MPDQQPDAEAAALLAAYQRQVQAQRNTLAAFLDRLWRSLGQYRNAEMAQFARAAVPVVEGAQRNVSSLTTAFLTHYRQLFVGGVGKPPAVEIRRVTGPAARNGTDMRTVYERPFHLVWRQLADGTAPADAIQSGLDRAQLLAASDLQLAKTHTAQETLLHDKNATGFRRVLRGAHSCGLCVVASTQRYHKAQLLPMHPACDCDVAPIYGDADEQVIEPQRLEAAHAAIAATFGVTGRDARGPVAYRDLLIVHEHGELGPVLARKGASFLGPNDV